MHRRAHFIWTPRQPIDPDATFAALLRNGPTARSDGCNRWFLFRRRFVLPGAADDAELHITADSRYQLFVNGVRAGRGPARCAPTHQRVDRYDPAALLRPGDNVFAVLVHVYGVDTAWYERPREYWQSVFGDGALYVDAWARCGDAVVRVRSDGLWRCTPCAAWRQDTARSGWGQGFIEDHDARLMPASWTEVAFDDSGWDPARPQLREASPDEVAKGWGVVEPFPTLLPRGIPMMLETPMAPCRVRASYGVLPLPALPLERRPYEETFTALPAGCVTEPDALLRDDPGLTVVRTTADRDVALLLEFDARHAGYPVIDLVAAGGEVVEVAVAETIPGEYSAAARAEPRLGRGSQLDCAHVFRYTARAGRQRFEKFDWTGVKYLQLVVRNAPSGLGVRYAGSIYTRYPADSRGAFECSDPDLNRLWEIGRYTALQCTHDAREDCPGREKRQWLGDGIVHHLVAAAAFGPSMQPIDRQFLLQATESQRADGLMQMFAPGDHHTTGITIPDFTLHWICAAHHYHMHTGDDGTVLRLLPAVQRALDWFEGQRGPNALLADLPHWHFIEWARLGRGGESCTVNALLAGALDAARQLADGVGFGRLAVEYAERAAQIRHALRSRHWDEERGIFVDSVDPVSAVRHPQVSQHANAAAILWDVASPEQWPRMLERMSDRARLRFAAAPPVTRRDEPFDPWEDVVRANTYFSHFVYGAFARARRIDLALAAMREQYAPMLRARSETLWESVEASASLCHAFSATPVHQLSAHVLGVVPAAPGFARARIAPQLGDLRHVHGIYPTVRGDIGVAWKRTDAKRVELTVALPEGVEGELVPPDGFRVQCSPGMLRGECRLTLTA